jgi:hypothetical protein
MAIFNSYIKLPEGTSTSLGHLRTVLSSLLLQHGSFAARLFNHLERSSSMAATIRKNP